jgi:hypothetical protein
MLQKMTSENTKRRIASLKGMRFCAFSILGGSSLSGFPMVKLIFHIMMRWKFPSWDSDSIICVWHGQASDETLSTSDLDAPESWMAARPYNCVDTDWSRGGEG